MATLERKSRDSLRSIAAAVLPITVAGTSITMQPGLVQGMVDFLRYDEVRAGYVASAEVFGIMAATVLFAFVADRIDWRRTCATGLIVIVLANIAAILLGASGGFVVARIMAGLGAGFVTAIGFASLAKTREPGRNYGWAVASIIGYSAIGFAVLPQIFDGGGYTALMIVYSLLAAACLPLVPFLPHRDDATDSAHDASSHGIGVLTTTGLLALAGILLFFIGYASAWTYMSLIGRDAGLDDVEIAHILSLSQFFGVAGALSVAFMGSRIGHLSQLFAILGAGAIGIFAFMYGRSYGVYFALNCLFQFAWNGGQPLLLGVLASRDESGRLLRFAIPLQFVGMALAPGIAAYLLGGQGRYIHVILGSGIIATLALAAALPITLRSKFRVGEMQNG